MRPTDPQLAHDPDAQFETYRWPRIFCAALGIFAFAVGLTSFFGWVLDIRRLTDWKDDGISIQPNATLCVLFSGVAVIFLAANRRGAARVAGLIVAAIAWGTGFEWLSGLSLGIDEIFMFGREWGRVGVLFPGRMGPPGATSWSIIAVAFLLAGGGPRSRRLVPTLGLAVSLIALVSLWGYLFRADVLFTLPRLTIIAMQTATCVLAVGIGLVVSEPNREPMATLSSDTRAGATARLLVPLAFVLPVVIGWLRVRGEDAGFYDSHFGSALRTGAESLLLTLLAWWSMRHILRHERALRRGREELATAARAVLDEKERYAVTLGSIGDAVIATDAETRVTFMNPTAERLTGWTRDEAVGRLLAEVFVIVNESTRLAVESPVVKALREGAIVGLANHTVLLARGGAEWPIDDSAAPIRRDGVVVGVVMVFHDITERRAVEREVAHLGAIVKSSDDAIISKDLNSIITSWNRGAQRIFGYSAEEALGRPITMLIPPDRAEEEPGILARIRRGENVDHFETVRRCKDGTLLETSLTVSPIRDSAGRVVGASKIARDITKRRVAEELIRRNGETFARLVEQAPFGVYVLDASFRMHQVNPVAQVAFVNVRPLIGRDFGEAIRVLWPEPLASEIVATFRRVLETGESYIAPSLTSQRNDEEIVESYEWQVHRVTLPDGQAGVVCYFFNTTPLRRAELGVRRAQAALKVSENRYRRLFEAAHDGIMIVETATRTVTDANPFMLGLLGVTLEDLVGKQPWEIGIFPDQMTCEATMRTLSERGSLRFEPTSLGGSGGRQHLVEIVANTYQEGKGMVAQFTLRDISERLAFERERQAMIASERALRMEADSANRAKDVFLATLSHELRTPLNAIVGWTSILQRDGCAEEDLREGLNVIDRNARMQSQLIEDVMDVSRIVTGKMRLEMKACDLHAAVSAGVETVRPAAAAKGVTLKCEIECEAASAVCDAGRVQQIAWNLVANAVKFTPRGGRVTVRLTREASSLKLTVTDTGPGIDPELLPHVFDRFRQADGSTRRKFGGLGLGLSIVKHLTELHGGTVHARNDGQGPGAVFEVLLPIQAVQEQEQREEVRLASPETDAAIEGEVPMRLDGLHVLLVDDEPDARSALTRVLQSAGAIVVAAGSAAEARRLLETVQPHVLVSDVGMPDEDGYDLIRALRAQGHSEMTLPAVALTAFAGAGHAQSALVAGFQVHVSKPVDPHDLIVVVGGLAGRTGR